MYLSAKQKFVIALVLTVVLMDIVHALTFKFLCDDPMLHWQRQLLGQLINVSLCVKFLLAGSFFTDVFNSGQFMCSTIPVSWAPHSTAVMAGPSM
jgi:hypothetical protein